MRQLVGGVVAIVAASLVSLTAVAPDAPGSVVINEIAWAGASWDATAEWIELYNTTPAAIDLAGWRLVSSDGAPYIDLCGTIQPHVPGDSATGFFLLERATDDAVPDLPADLIYDASLTDRGEALYLYEPSGRLVDSANASDGNVSSPWPAGSDAHAVPPHASMERIDPLLPDRADNWVSSTAVPFDDCSNRPILGTPRAENSGFNLPPTPVFEVRPRIPPPGYPVEFDASCSSDDNDRIEEYRWDFGDGTGGSGPIVGHTFAESGEYRVTLTLADGKGGWSELARIVVVEPASPPSADFSIIVRPPDHVHRAGRPIRFQDESSDPEGDIVSWQWDFGDGATATERNPSHSYEQYGEYVVALWVVDAQGEAAVQSRSLTIASLLPIAELTRSPDRPNAGETVRLDASASNDPDGRIARYRWDFDGDGTVDETTSDPIVERRFAAGEIAVLLTVVDDAGGVSLAVGDAFAVNAPPIAEFRLSSFEADELEPICFTDLSHDEDGEIVDRFWAFGDGATAATADPAHAFDAEGTYAVSLTVTDDNGSKHTTTAEVVIANLPPTADLSTEALERPTGEPFPFDASRSSDPSPCGSIAVYEWDLDGDGTYDRTTTAATLSHAFDDDGTYSVRLRVTDDDGASTVSDPLTVRITNRSPRMRSIDWAPERPTDGDEVLLSATATDDDGEIAQWFWDFDDGIVITASGPTVRFPASGTFTVGVSAEDDDGARSPVLLADVVVANTPPIAEFGIAAVDGLCVRFDGSASVDPSPSGVIRHIAWSFGDGTSCPGDAGGCGSGDRWSPVHCYGAPGTYTVTLVVIDDRGALARTARTIHVAD